MTPQRVKRKAAIKFTQGEKKRHRNKKDPFQQPHCHGAKARCNKRKHKRATQITERPAKYKFARSKLPGNISGMNSEIGAHIKREVKATNRNYGFRKNENRERRAYHEAKHIKGAFEEVGCVTLARPRSPLDYTHTKSDRETMRQRVRKGLLSSVQSTHNDQGQLNNTHRNRQ